MVVRARSLFGVCLALGLALAQTPAPQLPQPPLTVRWTHSAQGGFYAAPTVADGLVFASSLDRRVYALDALTGRVVWSHETGDRVYGGVAVAGALAFAASSDRSVYAFEARSGKLRWQRQLDGLIYMTPVVVDDLVVIGTGETGTLSALDAGSGRVRWTVKLGDRAGSGLVAVGGLLYVPSFDRKLHVLEARTGQEKWSFATDGIVDSMPLVADGTVYLKLPNDTVYALDATTGAQKWKYTSPSPPIGPDQISNWSNLALAEGLLLFGSLDEHLYALDARSGERRWAYRADEAFACAPTVLGPLAWAPNKDGSLRAVTVKDGGESWKWADGGTGPDAYLRGIMWPPTAAGGRLYAASMDGKLYCFESAGRPAPTPPTPPTPAPPVEVTRAITSPALTAARIALRPVEDEGGEAYKLSFTIRCDGVWPAGAACGVILDGHPDGSGHALLLGGGQTRLFRGEVGGQEGLLADAPAPPPRRVTIHREPWRLRVLLDDEVKLVAQSNLPEPGKLLLGTNSDKLTLEQVLVQPTEEPWFTDDFMRSSDGHGAWTPRSGKWQASGVSDENARDDRRPNADYSSNPFAYRASDAAQPALATCGQWFWDNYRAEVSVRPGQAQPDARGRPTVALCVYLQDQANYLAFEWSRGGADDERRLVAVRGGRREVLAAAPGGWQEDCWYRLGVDIAAGRLEAFIDGLPVLSVDTELFGQGQVGLLAEGVRFADFDDVAIGGSPLLVCDRFDRRSFGRWQAIEGLWGDEPTAAGEVDRGLKVLKGGAGEIVTGRVDWSDYRITAVARAPGEGGLGLVACYQGPRDSLALRWGGGNAPAEYREKMQLVRRREGRVTVLAETAARPLRRSRWYRLELENRAGLITARIDGEVLLQAYQPDLTAGKAGLLAYGADRPMFDRVTIERLEPEPPIEFEPPVAPQFSREELMADWAQARGAWWTERDRRRDGVLWHRGLFHGDLRVALDAAKLRDRSKPLEIIVGGDGQRSNRGWVLRLTPDRDKRRVTGELRLDDRRVDAGDAPLDDAEVLTFERVGRLLLVRVDGQMICRHALGEGDRPAGTWLGLKDHDQEFDLGRVAVRAANNYDTTFMRAPVEWQVAKGLWETTNRWKCDARWSFFGGFNDLNPTIWTKDDFAGEIQVEAFLGFRMDQRQAPHYLHPSDLCVTVGGDGREVTSGWSFLFAARNNQASLLYRDGRLIAENDKPEARLKYTSDEGEGLVYFHRHWFHLVIRKAGGRVVCSLDDKVIFDVPDDQPDATGKVAIYSVNNGIIVSRVKIWHQGLAERRPFVDPGRLRAAANPGQRGGSALVNDFEAGLGTFEPTDPRRVLLGRAGDAAGGRFCLAATNLVSGGRFGFRPVFEPFRASERPLLRFRYKAPATARLDLHVKLKDKTTWHLVTFLGGEPDKGDGEATLGRLEAVADGTWRTVSFDLQAALRKLYDNEDPTLEGLEFGMWRPDPYLHAGFGTNPCGTVVYLDDFALGPR